MTTRTIETTPDEDEAIAYAHQQSMIPGVGPPVTANPTEAEFFQYATEQQTIAPMVTQHQQAKNAQLVSELSTIPPENRDAAQADLEALIIEHGGTVAFTKATYFWSANTAPPPRVNSVELDATEANFATVTKITFDDVDKDNVSRMTSLMALAINTTIRLADAANSANYLQVRTTAAPIQRQGADGHVEIAVTFLSKSGSFATLDTKPLTCSFS